MHKKKMNWAVVGTSFISEVMAQAIIESNTGELIAIASRDLEKARSFAQQFSIPNFYDDYEALLANDELDAVYIGLPNHLHKEWIIRCALAGKHVLCEKPLLISEQDVIEVQTLLRDRQIVCMEGLMYLHHPLIQTLKELIEQQLIGEPRLYNVVYNAQIAAVANPKEGGCIRNLGCYPVSLVRLLAQDEPVYIQGVGRLNAQGTSDNCCSVLLKFADESVATISTADDLEMRWQFEVYGSKGHLKVHSNPWLPGLSANKIVLHLDHEEAQELTIEAPQSLYSYQIDAFYQQLKNPRHSTIPLAFSFGNLKVLETWRRQVFASQS